MSEIGETRLRVRYAETDQMGVVYYANFLVWFELGRVELIRELGFRLRDVEREDGCYMPVVDVRCRYKAPAIYDDELTILTRLSFLRGSMVQFSYEILRDTDNKSIAEGETIHMVTDAQMNVRPLPEKYARAFEAVLSK